MLTIAADARLTRHLAEGRQTGAPRHGLHRLGEILHCPEHQAPWFPSLHAGQGCNMPKNALPPCAEQREDGMNPTPRTKPPPTFGWKGAFALLFWLVLLGVLLGLATASLTAP